MYKARFRGPTRCSVCGEKQKNDGARKFHYRQHQGYPIEQSAWSDWVSRDPRKENKEFFQKIGFGR